MLVLLLQGSIMSAVDHERNLTVTTHYTMPTLPSVIHVPARFTLDETHEAIHAVVSKHIPESRRQPISSIIIASGEYFHYIFYSLLSHS